MADGTDARPLSQPAGLGQRLCYARPRSQTATVGASVGTGKRHEAGRQPMQTLKIGDVTITSIIERDGPWRKPEDMF
ncbi:MAG TPA: hypothetical protein VIV01_03640, partial [Hyphomicrobiaceae bacterium]